MNQGVVFYNSLILTERCDAKEMSANKNKFKNKFDVFQFVVLVDGQTI